LCFLEFGAPGEKDVCVLPKGHLGKHSFTGDIEEDEGRREDRKREAWDYEIGAVTCLTKDPTWHSQCIFRAYHRGKHSWADGPGFNPSDPESVPQIIEPDRPSSIKDSFPTREQRIRIHALEAAVKTYQGGRAAVYIERAQIFEQYIIAGEVDWKEFE
jgi:hypothetical protein